MIILSRFFVFIIALFYNVHIICLCLQLWLCQWRLLTVSIAQRHSQYPCLLSQQDYESPSGMETHTHTNSWLLSDTRKQKEIQACHRRAQGHLQTAVGFVTQAFAAYFMFPWPPFPTADRFNLQNPDTAKPINAGGGRSPTKQFSERPRSVQTLKQHLPRCLFAPHTVHE